MTNRDDRRDRTSPRQRGGWLVVVVVVVTLLALLAPLACDRGESSPGATRELRVWLFEPDRGLEAVFRQWERRNPGWTVVSSFYGGRDAQKLLTAIAGGDPPQVVVQDRFTVGEWAARGAFRPLDDLVAASSVDPAAFYPSAWAEATYGGRVYAIPYGVDNRALYYNKRLLREAGLVDASGEAQPPRDWDELKRYAVALTQRDARRRVTRLGFAPNYGDSWLYVYAFLNGGRFLSDDGRTVTLDAPENVAALRYMVDVYDAVGGMDEAHGFVYGTTGMSVDPFMTGRVAMKIDGNWDLKNIAEYAPDLDFGVAPPPAPAGKPSVTWGGGYSFVIPRGARDAERAFDLIALLTSDEGYALAHATHARHAAARGRGYVPQLAARPDVNERLLARYVEADPNVSPNVRRGLRTFLDLMRVTKNRPVTPVGQLLWDEHVRAVEAAGRRNNRPDAEAVLRAASATVQRRLDVLLAEADGVALGPPVRWGRVWTIAVLLAVALAAGLLHLARRAGPAIGRRDEARAAAAFLAPWGVGFPLLTAGPIVASLVISFSRYDVLHPAAWAGVGNYRRMLGDDLFWLSLLNTLYMLVSVPAGLALGLGVALLLNAEVRGVKVYRTLVYLPVLVPAVAASILWIWLLNPQSGLVNQSLRALGVDDVPTWLSSASWGLGSKAGILLVLLWGAGSGMIIWLAGLKGIPRHLYEAAEIDGAGPVRRFFAVTLPMLTPYVFFNLVIGVIGVVQLFTPAMVMTQGGPADSTLFFAYHLFNAAFRYFDMGYASALAWVMLLIVLVLTLLQLWAGRRWVHYEAA